jgi:tRNA-binding protein
MRASTGAFVRRPGVAQSCLKKACRHGFNGEANMAERAAGQNGLSSYPDFEAVDIRVGTIVEAQPYPEARKPSIKLVIDFGPEIGRKKSSAQIAKHYTPETLVGRQVAAVVNFPPRQIGKFISEVLTLGFPDEDGGVVLISPTLAVPNGGKLF